MNNEFLGKSLLTNKITKEEAIKWFDDLKIHTDQYVKKTYPYYSTHKLYPVKAFKKDGASKSPYFIINHHTSGQKESPGFYRFCNSKMASANFIVGRDGNILYLVSLEDMAYHATNGVFSTALYRLMRAQRGWIDEPGIETVGNGLKWLFEYEQFKNLICLQRNIVALKPTIKIIKSHRFFSPVARAGDPGTLYFLPLVQHAIFNDVNLEDPNYWLEDYKSDPINFANNVSVWFDKLGITKEEDEWNRFRNRKVTEANILR